MNRLWILVLGTTLTVGCGQQAPPASQASQETAKPTVSSTPDQPETTTAAAAQTQTPEAAPQAKNGPSYEQLITAANQFIQKRDLNNSLRVLTQAIKTDPNRAEGFIRRAAVLAEGKAMPQAVRDMSMAIKLEPKSSKLHNTRGYFLLLLKQYELAEKDFNAAIDLKPDYPQALNNRGLVFLAVEEHVKALNDFRMAIKVKPDYVDAHNNLGYTLMQMDENQQAVEALTKCIEIDGKYINAVTNRGRAYFNLENYDQAIADYTKAIELQPENLHHYLHRSEAAQAAGDDKAALADRNYVAWEMQMRDINGRVKSSPKDPANWLAQGRHLLRQDRWEDALKAFRQAETLDPGNVPAMVQQAEVHLNQKQYDLAVEVCTKILDKQPNLEALGLRGDAYFQLDKLDEAIADYEAAKRIDSKVAQAYAKRAEQRKASGDVQLASHDEKQATLIQQRLDEQKAEEGEQAAPRPLVIEQASFEEKVEEPKEAPTPEDSQTEKNEDKAPETAEADAETSTN